MALSSAILDNPTPPDLPLKVMVLPKRKRALGHIRNGAIEIIIPKHWPKVLAHTVTQDLARKVQQAFNSSYDLVLNYSGPVVSFHKKTELVAWIHEVNDQTLRVPLKGVRMGYSRYTQLAQMNLRSHVMTVSKYCLHAVPESALHYLVIHELAHINVPDHSKAFWQQVACFVPDYRYQRRLISAFHHIRVYQADQTPRHDIVEPIVDVPSVASIQAQHQPGLISQLLLKLHL